jgi:lipoic acid synthetase
MLLGDVCTRGCRFCAVTTGRPGALDEAEPEHVAQAIGRMALQYVVLTMVDRDDLPDGGALQVARTVERLKMLRSDLLIETLVGDFLGQDGPIDTVLASRPDVFAHNQSMAHHQARARRAVRLRPIPRRAAARKGKGPTADQFNQNGWHRRDDDEVIEAFLRSAVSGVDIVAIGPICGRDTETPRK